MSNKAIGQYNETTTPQNDDEYLLQRGNDYFKVKHENVGFGLKRATVTLSSVQITNLNSSPQTIASAGGAGVYLIPVRAYAKRNAGTAYATQTAIRIRFNGEADGDYLFAWPSFLDETADTLRTPDVSNLDNENLIVNTALEVYAPTADPTGGDGTVEVVLYYEERSI